MKLIVIHLSVLGLLALDCFWGCPVQFLLGISCPGCGLTRAWRCFFRGDWHGAVGFHFFFLPTPLFILLFAHRGTALLPASRRLDTVLIGFSAVLAVYQAWRVFFQGT